MYCPGFRDDILAWPLSVAEFLEGMWIYIMQCYFGLVHVQRPFDGNRKSVYWYSQRIQEYSKHKTKCSNGCFTWTIKSLFWQKCELNFSMSLDEQKPRWMWGESYWVFVLFSWEFNSCFCQRIGLEAGYSICQYKKYENERMIFFFIVLQSNE